MTTMTKSLSRPAGYKTPWEKARPYVYILPALIFLGLFTVYPVIDMIIRSFQKWNLVTAPTWVGIKNYDYIFKRKEFREAIVHTITYAIFVVGLGLSISTLFAVWLSALISVAKVWAWIMNKNNGLLNMVLNFFGLPSLKWADSADTAMMSIIIVALWKAIGYNTMLIYAAIQNVPRELYEAADLDNANAVKKFFKITLPMISPQMFMLLITATTGSFRVFDTVRVMTHGGPGTATQVLVYYIYEQAFVLNNKVGYAFAASVVLMVMIGVLTAVYFRILSKRVHYQ